VSAAAQAGVCRYCGATEAQVDGDKLCWLSRARDCCNKYSCRKADAARPVKPRSEFAGWGRGAIDIEMRRRRRNARRRSAKGKAA